MFRKTKKSAEEIKQAQFDDTKAVLENRDHQQKREHKKELKELLAASQQFQQSRIEMVEKSERRAWKIAFAGVGVGVLGVVAVACLAPFKTAVPYLLRYNSETGYTDLAPVYQNNKKTLGEAVDKYFLSRFVIYHEGYDWQTIQNSADNVALMSNDRVTSEYNANIRSEGSPLKVLGEDKKLKIDVISVTFLGDVAQIRYRKTVLNSAGQPDTNYQAMNYIATVNYDYGKKITFDKDRINVNPLGFEALSWNSTPENVSASSR
ncbi:virB8 family protein [Candidatus Pantoea formicae]|uniref:virB8 family protein n=1 Tax=Candidatus Pantoea formicae TaxID=2608355 RepID=UPI003ED9E527